MLQFALFPVRAVADAEAEPPLAVPVDGAPFRAEVAAIDDQGRITFLAGQTHRVLPAADLVYWGRCPEQGRAGGVVPTSGGFVAAEVVTADDESLTAESDLLRAQKIPLESLAGVVFHPPPERQRRDALLDRIVRATGDSDLLLLNNGDELRGLLSGIHNNVVKLATDVGPIKVETDRAAALVFNPALRRRAAKAPPKAWVGFRDGTRLPATRLLVEDDSLQLTTAGQTWKIAANELVFLQPLGGRAVYLSDLKPDDYRQTPYLDLPWPYKTDRNATGGMLRCGGRLFMKGLGVHSAAQLTFSTLLAGEGQGVRAKRFEALAGIDDSTAGQGSVRFRVLVDGQEKYTSATLRGGDPPVPVTVDLTDAKTLELIVDYADRADVLDHADWLDARLIN